MAGLVGVDKQPFRFGIRHLVLVTFFVAFLLTAARFGVGGFCFGIGMFPVFVLGIDALPSAAQGRAQGNAGLVIYIRFLLLFALAVLASYATLAT